ARARRLGRRVGALLPGLVGVCVLLFVVTNSLAGRALEGELALVRSEGAPLSLREVAPPSVPDNENAALLYQQAFQRLPRLAKPGAVHEPARLDQKDEGTLRIFLAEDGNQRKRVSLAQVRQALAGTDAALALARQAAAMPR